MTIDELFSWLDETTAYQAKSRSSSREAKDKPTDKKPTTSRTGPDIEDYIEATART
ncbi:MAG: hypothetical protein ABWY12_08735 [Burkholderiales bacterium]